MKINGIPSAMGLQHMAARALEARTSAGLTNTQPVPQVQPSSADNTVIAGENLPEDGESLPASAETSPQQTERNTGLSRAIERLQQNIEQNPDALGLLKALENLTENQSKAATVDTEA